MKSLVYTTLEGTCLQACYVQSSWVHTKTLPEMPTSTWPEQLKQQNDKNHYKRNFKI